MPSDEARQEQQRRAALNQSLFRQVNEAIKLKHDGAAYTEFTCECWQTTCDVPVSLAIDEYEEVRKDPKRFFVSPGHLHPVVERVVYETPRYQIVEKIEFGAKVAERLAPRH